MEYLRCVGRYINVVLGVAFISELIYFDSYIELYTVTASPKLKTKLDASGLVQNRDK